MENKDDVDAFLVAGSKSIGEDKSYSDIDMAVILKENKNKIFSLFQYVDDRPADIFFYDISTVEKLLNDEEISANTMDAVLVNWIETAKIEFDKSSTLSKLQKERKTCGGHFVIQKLHLHI